MWSEYLKTQQRTEEERWEFMKMPARLFYQVRTIGQKPTNLKWLIIKVTDKLLLCKLFFFFLVALVRANKALGDLLWGISIAGKLRSFSGDWDENISFVMKCAQCRKICHTCCWDSSVCHLPFVLAVSFLSCSVCDGSGLQTKSVPDLREQDAVPRTGFKTDFS